MLYSKATDLRAPYRISKPLAGGVAETEMPKLLQELYLLASTLNNLDTNIIKFEGIDIIPPEEAVEFMRKNTIDVSRSDMYLIGMRYTLYGKEIVRPTLVPYLPYRTGTIMYLGGASYRMIHRLSDYFVSLGGDNVFLRLNVNKARIGKLLREYVQIVDGKEESMLGIVIINDFFKSKATSAKTKITKSKPTVIGYLLATYGWDLTMEKIGFPSIKVGSVTELKKLDGYTIFKTCGIKPSLSYIGKVYKPTQVALAMPTSELDNMDVNYIKLIIGSLFYIIDHFPRLTAEEITGGHEEWRIILSQILMGNKNEIVVMTTMHSHLAAVRNYLDQVTAKKAVDEFGDTLGIDFFAPDAFMDLLIVIMKRFNFWVSRHTSVNANAYGKKARILYWLLSPLQNEINAIYYGVSKLIDESTHGELPSEKAISKLLNYITMLKMHYMRDTDVMDTIIYGGDNMALKPTSTASLQLNLRSSGDKTGGGTAKPDEAQMTNASHISCGTVPYVSKGVLLAVNKVNWFGPYNEEDRVFMDTAEVRMDMEELNDVLEKLPTGANTPDQMPSEFGRYILQEK